MAESGVSAARGTDQTWKIGHSFAVCVVMAAVGVVGLLTPASSGIYSWLGIMGLLTVLTFVAGHGVTGRLLGCLIDGRNRMSLARLQTILWTLVILSAFLAGALIRISAGVSDSLVIGIPEQLWIVMGISITSLVGSPLIISSKKDKKPREEEKNKTIATLAEQGERTSHDGITNVGQVIVKADPAQASISDLFKGDETANAAPTRPGKDPDALLHAGPGTRLRGANRQPFLGRRNFWVLTRAQLGHGGAPGHKPRGLPREQGRPELRCSVSLTPA
jgi:hypothetical protein